LVITLKLLSKIVLYPPGPVFKFHAS